ncbi:MAG: hypothetical protein ABIH70_08860 [Chloroflexota bacterium]
MLDEQPLASIDDIHRHLTRDVIGKKLSLGLLWERAVKLEASIVPAESPE